VVRLSYTSARLTRKALELLYHRQVHVPGVILNYYVDTSLPEYYYYQYAEYYNRPGAPVGTLPPAREKPTPRA
jgi:Mrp family chromosome partitioning ATPase